MRARLFYYKAVVWMISGKKKKTWNECEGSGMNLKCFGGIIE